MGKWKYCVTVFLALYLMGEAHAEELSRQGKRFVATFDGAYGQVPVHPAICSGKYGLVLYADAENLSMAVDANLYFVGRDFKAVPKGERANLEIKTRSDKFTALKLCQKVIYTRQKVLKAEAEAIKARKRKFKSASSQYYKTIKSLTPFLTTPSDVASAHNAALITRWKTDLEALDALCTGPFSDIKNDICTLASKHTEVVEQVARNTADRYINRDLDRIIEHTNDFEKYDGYFRIGKLAESALFDPQSIKDHAMERFRPVLSVAGLNASGDVWDKFDKEMLRFRNMVVELGPKWNSPKKEGGIGSIAKAATKYFKQAMPKGTKVKKSYLTRGSWQIHKNTAGVPLRRTKPIFVIYTEPGDSKIVGKLCRGRSFTYTEQYNGRKYSKSDVISEPGYLRFGACK